MQKKIIKNPCDNYYNKVIKNFNSNKIFYNYYDEKHTYLEAKKFVIKFFYFIKNIKKKLNIENKRLNVVVLCEKSFELYALIESIFLTNNIFIPISKSTPIFRLENMLRDVNADLIFFDTFPNKNFQKRIQKKYNIIRVNEVNEVKKIKNYKKNILNLIHNYENTAMIYFTSGSTGNPKGIKISHKNYICNFFLQKKHLYLENKFRNLIFGDYHETSFSIFFDIYFPAMYFGSILCPAKTSYEITSIIEHALKNKINVLITVPSTIQRIMSLYIGNNINLRLKIIMITGETFYLNQLNYIFSNFIFKKLFNCYGSTELSNWAFFHDCSKKDLIKYKKFNLVPIGKLFNGLRYKIINEILHIGGDIVSLGYIDKIFNKKKFYLKDKTKWYNTEDRVVKYKENLVCKGRNKNITKIFGYRIDISDIEINMRRIKNLDEVYVIKFEEKRNEYLVAFVKFTENNFSEKIIQNLLLKYLPVYMIPKRIINVLKFPLNQNGKVDRSAFKKLL